MNKSNLISFAAVLLLSSQSMAFTPSSTRRTPANTFPNPWLLQHHHHQQQHHSRSLMIFASEATTESATSEEEVASFPSTFSTASVYEQIGISEDQLALGIEAEEVLQYIGARQDLLNRLIQDIPKLENDKEKAEAEVDKFLMDAEMLNSLITYEKAKANDKEGMFGSSQAQEDLSFRNPKVIATYAAWIAGGVGFSYIRRVYIQPKFDSGEWEQPRITLPNPMNLFNGGGGDSAVDAAIVNAVATTAQDVVVDAATTTASTVM